ncbi:MAG: response regulator [Acidobacteriia bacterium]|nr:response regulator [Terriglobia bacterium]
MDDKKKKILIADDDKTTRDLLREVFEDQQYAVFTVSDGRQAAEWLEREECHVLLADLRMPYLSGLQLFQGVKKSHPGVHCVLITSCIDNEVREHAEAIGIDRMFEKPVNMEQLLNCVATLVSAQASPGVLKSEPAFPA